MSVNIALVLACSLACSSVDGRRIVSVGNKDAVGDVGSTVLEAANAKSSLQSDVKKADDAERAENDSDLDVNEADDAEHAESGFNVLESGLCSSDRGSKPGQSPVRSPVLDRSWH